MVWQSEWKAIAARLGAVIDAGSLFMDARQSDYYGKTNSVILPEAREVLRCLTQFKEKYRPHLPSQVEQALARYGLELRKPLDGDTGIQGTLAVIVIFAALRGELNHVLSVSEVATIAGVERGFQHLQRSIIADADFAKRWQTAFTQGEVACEKLGAAHLLLHRIWAFKADARGERTDLILGAHIADAESTEVAATGSVLALTEWKVVGDAKDLGAALAQAERQARLYAYGSLGSLELHSCRYIVIVTSDRMQMPDNATTAGVTYRHVNIAVAPSTPSKSSV